MTTAADAAVLDRWWRAFVATGHLPAELQLVQGRLVRSVYQGELPSGSVHVKVMTFPRAKDRLRYVVRALPAEHEANMLAAVAAAGLLCPQVVAVRTARRLGLPFRSMLVLRTLAAAKQTAPEPVARLRAEALLTKRLLAAGIEHRDLHSGNFLRCADGQLAVLDLQSANVVGAARASSTEVRLAAAARLVREREGLTDADALAVLRSAALVLDDREQEHVRRRLLAERQRFWRTRMFRCLTESTEFTWRWRWSGREYRWRAAAADGRWWWGGRVARAAWLGQRVLQLADGRTPLFSGYFQKWWWLGGGAAMYVPNQCSDERIEQEVRAAVAGLSRLVRS